MRALGVSSRVFLQYLTVIAAACALGGVASAQQPPPNPVQVHIGHVMTTWTDTPGRIGLLPAAIADAHVAEEQAHKTDLEGRINDFILYSGYTLNALDPTPENKALIEKAYTRLPVGADPRLKVDIPGSGYGVKRAVAGALQHVQLAAKSDGASDNVKTHAMHVSTSLENVVKWTDEAIALAQKILVAKNVAEGQSLVTALEDTAVHIDNGFDANNDGQIGWEAGEGGLEQALMHMRLMMRGEGMADSSPAGTTSSRTSDPATSQPAAPPPPQQIASDRIWAEWMLRMGGAVVLEGQQKLIADLADLPTTDFRIHTLNFTGITMYGASLQDELRHLPPLPHLKELYINGRLWYDQPAPRLADTIGLFASSTELEKLVLSRPVQTYIPMNDAALKQLAPLKNLKELRVRQTRSPGLELSAFPLTHLDLNYVVAFGDDGMSRLKNMSTLTELYVRGTSITDEGLKNLAGLTNLVELDLADDNLSDAGLSALGGLTKLRKLSLQGADVTDAGLDVLRNMPELQELSLYRTKVSNAGLAKLSALKNLRAVDLRYSRATGAGVRELMSSLPNADVLLQDSSSVAPKRTKDAAAVATQGEPAIGQWLQSIGGKVQLKDGHVTSASLAGTTIADAELATLAKLPQLGDLSLQHTEVSSVGLAHLSSIKSLRSLDLGDTLLGDDALASLSPLANLRSLRLEGTLVEGPGLAALAKLTNLRELYLDNAPLTDAGLDQVAKIYGLEVLSLRYTNVTDDGMARIGQLKNLLRLDLSAVDVTEKGLQSLAGLTNLVDLDLSFARFAEPGLQVLVTLPQLQRLGLEQTTVTDKAMPWIAKLPKLEALNLNYTTVTDAGFAKLAGLTSLAELKLDRTDISDASLAWLTAQKSLRYADLYHTLITEQGHQNLIKAFPKCDINWSLDATRTRRRT
jgi:Leucine-rich repeat (LRR) protein